MLLIKMFIQTVLSYSKLILPWFLFGIILAYFVEKYFHPAILKRISGKFSFLEILLIAILGMISPLSIMSFLPLAKELTEWGVPASVLFSFFLAERAYDLQSFFIISGLFNFGFSVMVAAVIFLSLIATIYSLKKEDIYFRKKGKREKGNFWIRQLRTLLIVLFGIIIGALLRTFTSQDYFISVAGSKIGGTLAALLIGFTLYLGPILGNYPLAKAFSELGMSTTGVLTFLSISPIFNFVIMLLFSSTVGFRKILKATLVYTATGLVLISIISYIYF